MKIAIVAFFIIVIGFGIFAGVKGRWEMCDNTSIICE